MTPRAPLLLVLASCSSSPAVVAWEDAGRATSDCMWPFGADAGPGHDASHTDAFSEVDAGESPNPPDCRPPPVASACDCRSAVALCPGFPCGVLAECQIGPFWYDRQTCRVEHRLAALEGCERTDAGAVCCDGTQPQAAVP